MKTTDNLAQQLRRWIRRGRVMTSPAQLAGYDTDGLGYKTFRPDAVVIPADAEELVEFLRHADELSMPVCVRGAGTSLSGGPVAAQGGVVVHTSALRQVRQISADGFWCEVECGVTLHQLDEALKPHGVFYPPDPSSGPVCTLGGNVAMNAGGAHCFRYGVTSNYVLGVEAVLLDGSVHRFGGPAGGCGPWREDWKRLMVGSEGTLGAFTRFWLRTLPRPEKVWTFRATYPDLATAERAIHELVVHPAFPVAIELMDPRCVAMVENSPMAVGLPKDSFMLLTEIDGPPELVDARVESIAALLRRAGSTDVVYSDDEAPRQKLWKARKVAGGLMGQMSADFVVQDAVIPKRALAELLQLVYDEADAVGLSAVNVFHAGDGNLHPNFLFDSRKPGQLEQVEHIGKRLMQRVVEVGGTLSGEHGIGNDKTAYMPLVFGPETTRLQLSVPYMFNPRHQLNPLKVFAQRRWNGANGTNAGEARSGEAHRSGAEKVPTTATEQSPGDADQRCFQPFLDPIDGVLCLPASSKLADIQERIGAERLRFPLILAPEATLAAQVAASRFAPASSRFGPYCDNIVGMNWRLPNGRVVRIGERVVKTTTGYDLFRLWLHTGHRFGEPVDFVLRLRPDCGPTGQCLLKGDLQSLKTAIPELLRNGWMHWFDSCDLVLPSEAAESHLRIVVNGPEEEWPLVARFLQDFAVRRRLACEALADTAAPHDGLPDLVLKTSPERVVGVAERVWRSGGVSCVVLGYCGVIHVRSRVGDEPGRLESLARAFQDELHAAGGDWHSRHLPPWNPGVAETEWLRRLGWSE